MKKNSFIALLLILAVFFGVTSVALAHGGNTSLVHACINKTSGAVRIVGANTNCNATENALHWSITGPRGPRGYQGPQGLPAPTAGLCVGTYLVSIGNPVQSRGIWTFSQDGTFQGSDSAEGGKTGIGGFPPFGHGQGVWKDITPGVAKMSNLNFRYASPDFPNATNEITRVDADLAFTDNCQDVTGTQDLSFFSAGDDPFTAVPAFTILDVPFTGHRLDTLP